MAEMTFEQVLSVSDFKEKAGSKARWMFEMAEDEDGNRDAVVKLMADDVLEALGEADARLLTVDGDSVEFLEFDSPNPLHAGAYYSVTVTGPQELLDRVMDHVEGE